LITVVSQQLTELHLHDGDYVWATAVLHLHDDSQVLHHPGLGPHLRPPHVTQAVARHSLRLPGTRTGQRLWEGEKGEEIRTADGVCR